jgi:ectoine hydroxylase-related dioxygenase (phytanoyl-CoA dioxygenase family)
MNEEQRYLFDLNGFLLVRNVIARDAVGRMNAFLDSAAETDERFRGQQGNDKLEKLLTWSPDFLALLDHPLILPMLKAVLGSHMRFDHEYAIFLQPGGSGLFLHGGGTPYDASQNYQVVKDRIYCGLVACAYALNDVPPGAGGFACIPGSHKSNFPCPANMAQLTEGSDIVRQVPVMAGDCILFAEALQHGTLPWKGPGIRRTLFYKYSPAHVRWGFHHYADEPGNTVYADLKPPLTETQRILLDPPHVDGKRRVP